ncbi:porin [Hyalangium sp.]|uniref:porin n=1 Tax=Hyalangium sp. TaxID=2028555 RepID=UPI002D6B2BDA|nr:porin [Hyalangium sp.]HYH99458.1 porin [Hyalangium sp.]
MKQSICVALLTLISSTAFAQAADPQPPTGSTSPAATSVDERLAAAESKLKALEEQSAETKKDVSPLKKLKISGYVQGRFQYQDPDFDEVNAEAKLSEGFSRFTVRRGRIKATYGGDTGQVVLQIDASPTGVALRDAEATLFIPGTEKNMSLTLGQMKVPFSYEVLQSSTEREFPERSRAVASLIAGERDRGLRFSGKFGVLRVAAGFFDGNGVGNTGFIGVDNDKEKDLIGRLSFDLKWISGGVSGWYGTTLGKRTGTDPDATRKAYTRSRIGADVQVSLELVPVGATAVKAEYIAGRTYQRNNVEQFGLPASGWWALIVQNLGTSNALALRYDYFDFENGRSPTESGGRLGSNNAIGTLGIAGIHNFSEFVKITAAYEVPVTATAEGGAAEDPSDNLFTVQLQVRY